MARGREGIVGMRSHIKSTVSGSRLTSGNRNPQGLRVCQCKPTQGRYPEILTQRARGKVRSELAGPAESSQPLRRVGSAVGVYTLCVLRLRSIYKESALLKSSTLALAEVRERDFLPLGLEAPSQGELGSNFSTKTGRGLTEHRDPRS